MSRKSRKRQRQPEREYQHTIATPRVSRATHLTTLDRLHVSPLAEIEDRRTHHPLDFFRPARMLSGHPVQPVNVNKKARSHTAPKSMQWHRLNFVAPKQTVMCVRRHQRKQVIIAKKLTRRGRGSPKRTNWYSKIGC